MAASIFTPHLALAVLGGLGFVLRLAVCVKMVRQLDRLVVVTFPSIPQQSNRWRVLQRINGSETLFLIRRELVVAEFMDSISVPVSVGLGLVVASSNECWCPHLAPPSPPPLQFLVMCPFPPDFEKHSSMFHSRRLPLACSLAFLHAALADELRESSKKRWDCLCMASSFHSVHIRLQCSSPLCLRTDEHLERCHLADGVWCPTLSGAWSLPYRELQPGLCLGLGRLWVHIRWHATVRSIPPMGSCSRLSLSYAVNRPSRCC